MLLSSLLQMEPYKTLLTESEDTVTCTGHTDAVSWLLGAPLPPTEGLLEMPSIPWLQQMIEEAWAQGSCQTLCLRASAGHGTWAMVPK